MLFWNIMGIIYIVIRCTLESPFFYDMLLKKIFLGGSLCLCFIKSYPVKYPVLTHQDHFALYRNVIQFIRSMCPRFTSSMKKTNTCYLSSFESLILKRIECDIPLNDKNSICVYWAKLRTSLIVLSFRSCPFFKISHDRLYQITC